MASGSDKKKYPYGDFIIHTMASGSDKKKYPYGAQSQDETEVVWKILEFPSCEPERQKRKEEMLAKIHEAKNSGLTLNFSYTTIAITGSSAAGKTSFLNLLNREKFTPHHHSTNVAESKQVVCVNTVGVVGSGKESQWINLDHDTMLRQLREYLNVEIQIPLWSKIRTYFINHLNLNMHTTKCQVEDDIVESRSSLMNFNRTGILQLGKVWKIVNILDTGGQPEFINLFPAISSSIIVTFIVLNMCGGVKSLDEPVKVIHSKCGVHSYEPYHLHYTNLDLIKLLMAFSKDSSIKVKPPLLPIQQNSKFTSTSYQCYVGTHKDQVSKAEIQKIENKLNCTADELKCKELLWESNEKVLFPVDNTTAGGEKEDPIAGTLRTRIQELVENSSVYDVPISWFILLLEMQKTCSQKEVKFLPYTEVVDICKKTNLSKDEKEVQNALLFFHLVGVLLYYHDVPGMCQYVIINHQWLFEKLTSLVNLTFERKGFNLKAISKFKYEGILNKSLIEEMNLQTDIKTDCFIALLEHLKVIAKINTENYFMPCVLHSQSDTSKILDQYGNLQHVQLLAHFVNNPLPRGFFCSLVVQICQNLPDNWLLPLQPTKQMQHTYNNLITFHTSDSGHSISLIDKIGYLEIQIRHKKIIPAIHYDVQHFLTKIFEVVCSHLQINYKQLCYGFLCNCTESTLSKYHIASLPKELLHTTHWICCPYSRMKLTDSHLIWLKPPPKGASLPAHLSGDAPKRVSEEISSEEHYHSMEKRSKLSPEPKYTELIEQLAGVVSWKTVAAHLLSDNDGSKVETIARNNHHIIEDCRAAMLREYIRIGEVSWKKVLEALYKAGEKNTADKIRCLL